MWEAEPAPSKSDLKLERERKKKKRNNIRKFGNNGGDKNKGRDKK